MCSFLAPTHFSMKFSVPSAAFLLLSVFKFRKANTESQRITENLREIARELLLPPRVWSKSFSSICGCRGLHRFADSSEASRTAWLLVVGRGFHDSLRALFWIA